MKKKIVILGSTGSIGKATYNIIKKNKKEFEVLLLTTNKNVKEILKQSKELKVKNIIVSSKKHYLRIKNSSKVKNLKIYNNLRNLRKILKKKVDYTMCAITGLDGLKPTLESIKISKNIAIANKESIICAWNLIEKELIKNNTKFIPVDSEHFSIWSLMNGVPKSQIEEIIITASGGPFLNKKLSEIKNIKPNIAVKHPNWKMGKKISIDSATLMNKIFEVIEAKKIFDLDIDKFKIIIHPKSYVHAIVHFKNGLVKFLAHDTNMAVPIMNSLYTNTKHFNYNEGKLKFDLLNGLNFIKPEITKFPVVKLLSRVKNRSSYFETILISINDYLVEKYLNGDINYLALNTNLVKLIKNPYFTRYYNRKPKNIIDIKIMIKKVNTYLNNTIIN